jgi:hypothetical protein
MAKESQRFAQLLQMAEGEAELFGEDPERNMYADRQTLLIRTRV